MDLCQAIRGMSRPKSHKILITGATGFLGKHLAKRLLDDGNDVYLTAAHDGKKMNVHKLDLMSFEQLKRKISEVRPTAVYHLGAIVNLSRDFKIGQKCLETNIQGTLNLLESLRSFKPVRFIFTSTEEIYGSGKIPYQEDQLPNPPSAYAVSKMAAEYLSGIYAKELGFSLVILRIGTMYGPGQPLSRFIPQIIVRALKNEDIPLNSGRKKRDYIYISDVIDALILSNNKEFKDHTIIMNLGGGTSYRLIEVVEKIISITKSRSKVLIGKVPDRTLEANEWLLDNQKAFEFLGWRPKTSLEEGLKQTINYYQNKM